MPFLHNRFLPLRNVTFCFACAVTFLAPDAKTAGAGVFNVREFGAKGDGHALDTAAIQKAIAACAASGGGRVLVPPGKYLSATIQLKSHVTFKLDAGATLIGCPEPNDYNHLTPPPDKRLALEAWRPPS